MTQTTFQAGGKVVFWSLRETDREKLRVALAALGLEGFTPEERTDFAALRDAVAEIYPNHLIRATEKNAGLEIVQEIRGETRNEYVHVSTAIVADACDGLIREDVQAAFARHKNILCGTSVTTALVKIVRYLGGVAIRPQGGIYWLEDRHAAIWEQIGKAIEDASIAGSAVYSMNVKYDASMVRAVTAAIVEEITAEAGEMEQEIQSGECGERALENRKKASLALREKVRTYEGLLGQTLPALTESLEKIELLAATASMDLAAKAAAETAGAL